MKLGNLKRNPSGYKKSNSKSRSEKKIQNVFQNSNNVYNNYIIQNQDYMMEPFYSNKPQKSSNFLNPGVSLVGQSKTKKQVYHLGKYILNSIFFYKNILFIL